LAGYWLGLDPSTFESKLQFPKFSRGIIENDWSASKEASVEKGIGIPTSPMNFIQKYHKYLMDCGVDGVKVDAQSVLGVLETESSTITNPPSPALQLQNALSTSPLLSNHSATGTIHCMAHAPEIFFRLPKLSENHSVAPYFRVADDFYPNNPASLSSQVVACAFNSLLFREVACPDWDMFTTEIDERSLQMHAISRCISGGPIYLSDPPHASVDARVISWLCCSDGTTFPCANAAVPAPRCLLSDPVRNDVPLILVNTNGTPTLTTSIVLGVFRLYGTGQWDVSKLDYLPSEGDIAQSKGLTDLDLKKDDLRMLLDDKTINRRYLSVCFFSGFAQLYDPRENSTSLHLGLHESEAVALLPLLQIEGHELAFMGIDGKINGAGSVQALDVNEDLSSLNLSVSGCGTFSIALSSTIDQVTVELNGQTLQSRRLNDKKDCLGDKSGTKSNILDLGFSILQFEIPHGSATHLVALHLSDYADI
jgi:raffinose synthase